MSRALSPLPRARSLLSRHGLIILRVPNADFYRKSVPGPSHWFRALSYNNLVGLPYLNGYSLQSLRRPLARTGFEIVAVFGASLSLLTPHYPEMDGRLRKEWYQACV